MSNATLTLLIEGNKTIKIFKTATYVLLPIWLVVDLLFKFNIL